MATMLPQDIYQSLLPELKKLTEQAPAFGEILLRANLHEGKITRITLGTDTTWKFKDDSQGAVNAGFFLPLFTGL